MSIERSWWLVSQLYRTEVGFVEKLKTIAGPCESLCGEAYVADLHVKNTGASHTHYKKALTLSKKWIHAHEHTHTLTHSNNKQEEREGA